MKVFELCSILESIAPLCRQEEWDNCGLTLGEFGTEVEGILICLDVSPQVICHAKENGFNFIISHHPLIFKPVKKITGEDLVQKMIIMAIRERISLYTMHTNYDFADYAMNDYIAGQIGLENIRGFSQPMGRNFMTGRIGSFPRDTITIKELAALVAKSLGINGLTYTGEDHAKVKNVLVSTGSFDRDILGGDLEQVDVIITGDVGYHAARSLMEMDVLVIDAGHFGTEITFSTVMLKQLRERLADVKIKKAEFESDIFKLSYEQAR